jgi:hypothetical protein
MSGVQGDWSSAKKGAGINMTQTPDTPDTTLATVPVTIDAESIDMDVRTRIEIAVASVEQDTPIDDVKAAICLFNAMEEWLDGQKEKLYAKLIPIIQAQGTFTIGPLLYSVGFTKPTVKCTDVGRVLDELMRLPEIVNQETGETTIDWPTIKSCMSSGAWKPATTQKLLPPALAKELFVLPEPKAKLVVTGPDDEKPVKDAGPKLQVVNLDFVR